jgi:hypothetical protein
VRCLRRRVQGFHLCPALRRGTGAVLSSRAPVTALYFVGITD